MESHHIHPLLEEHIYHGYPLQNFYGKMINKME